MQGNAIRSVIACAAMAVGLGACAGTDVISRVNQETTYSRGDVRRSVGPEAKVEILGAPGGDAQAVAQALRLPGFIGDKPFRAIAPGGAQNHVERFVLVFSPTGVGGGEEACSGALQSGGRAGVVVAAFCDGSKVDTQARLQSPHLSDPGSPEFQLAMRRLFTALLPFENELLRDGDIENDFIRGG